jgi:hypothetical protein
VIVRGEIDFLSRIDIHSHKGNELLIVSMPFCKGGFGFLKF